MISIIGAGPAGLYSSYLLSGKGYEVNVFDQKKKIGLPVQCTGIVTSKIKEIIPLEKNIIKNRIRKIELHSKNNSQSLSLKEPDLVLDREKFDQYLAEIAKKNGAKIHLEKKFIKKEKNTILIKDLKKNKIESFRTDFLIGADGPLSPIYNILNQNTEKNYYKGIQVRAKGSFDKDTFHVYLGSLCPNFFAWIVPENESIARIGLASQKNQISLLNEFKKKLEIKNDSIIETQAGLIPIYNPKIKTNKDNIYLIGDAASQIKSTTGGGIVQGLTAARCLSNAIADKKDYQKEWKKQLGKDLWIHLMLRKYLNRFKDKDYDKLVDMLKNDKLKNILETQSRDVPSSFMLKIILAEPGLLSFASRLFI
ncbi:MAG: NAD(P)/FAD-dependent oxidoreductase [Nanoarchaeota archaeon]|nr:NAD(P)/FAD-dependent oxidoreductase [Nanoarchaeota archaeon]